MILVTGGTGLVGAHLLLRLAKQDSSIRAIYRTSNSIDRVRKLFETEPVGSAPLFGQIEWVQADLNDIPKLENAFQGIDRVYHCAALISFDPGDFFELKRVNVRGTANIVNLCISFGIKKLCYVSSIAALSAKKGEPCITEESEWQGGTSVYGLSKYLAEMEVWRGTQENVPAVIVNPGVIVGPGFWGQGSGTFFIAAHKAPRHYPPGGTGFVTVDDVVKVMTALMDSGIRDERFILIDENLTFKRFMDYLAEGFNLKKPEKRLRIWQLEVLWRADWLRSVLMNKRRRLTRGSARSLRSQTFYSNDKIKKVLSYQFEDLPNAVARCCQAFLEDRKERMS